MKYSIWIEAEEWEAGWDIHDATSDVIVKFEDGSRWVASFFTYKYIQTIVEENRQTGECLQGKYYWSSDMLLVDECSRTRIEEVIEHLIAEDHFESIFDKCEDSIDEGETIKVIKSPSENYKVIVDKFMNGSYTLTVYIWVPEEQRYKEIYEQAVENEDNAIQYAYVKLGECSGEIIKFT